MCNLTMQQVKSAYIEACGREISKPEERFWKSLVDIVNNAYADGVLTGKSQSVKNNI